MALFPHVWWNAIIWSGVNLILKFFFWREDWGKKFLFSAVLSTVDRFLTLSIIDSILWRTLLETWLYQRGSLDVSKCVNEGNPWILSQSLITRSFSIFGEVFGQCPRFLEEFHDLNLYWNPMQCLHFRSYLYSYSFLSTLLSTLSFLSRHNLHLFVAEHWADAVVPFNKYMIAPLLKMPKRYTCPFLSSLIALYPWKRHLPAGNVRAAVLKLTVAATQMFAFCDFLCGSICGVCVALPVFSCGCFCFFLQSSNMQYWLYDVSKFLIVFNVWPAIEDWWISGYRFHCTPSICTFIQ